jgi:hypothetical protein
MLKEIYMRAGPGLLLTLVPVLVLAGCQRSHDRDKTASSSFDKRLRCAQFAQSGRWENDGDGPFLDETYYSPTLDTCVFVMKQSFPADKDGGIQNLAVLVDGLSRKQIWSNDPKAGETEQQVAAKVDQQLTKLQVIR